MKQIASKSFNWALFAGLIALIYAVGFSLAGRKLLPHSYEIKLSILDIGIITIPQISIWWIIPIVTIFTFGIRSSYFTLFHGEDSIDGDDNTLQDVIDKFLLLEIFCVVMFCIGVPIGCIAILTIISGFSLMECIVYPVIFATIAFLFIMIFCNIFPFIVALIDRMKSITKSDAFKGKNT